MKATHTSVQSVVWPRSLKHIILTHVDTLGQ